LLEWGTVMVVDKDAGSAFLGTQGDEFDAQKDIALNIAGALIAALIIEIIQFKHHKFKIDK